MVKPGKNERHWRFRTEPLVIVSFSVMMGILSLFFPRSGDDWTWATSVGMGRLENSFDGYNGRWLGNLAVLTLTRAEWLFPITVALFMGATLFLIAYIARVRSVTGYLVTASLIILLPLPVWRQTIVWISGFSNYAAASLCLLVLIAIWQSAWGTASVGRQRSLSVLALLFALAGTLFVEHVTILIVIGSFTNLICAWRRKVSVPIGCSAFLGAIMGAGIMFSNSAYRSIARGDSSYQELPERSLVDVLKTASGGVSQMAVSGNTALNIALFAVLAALGLRLKLRNQNSSGNYFGPASLACLAVASGAAIEALRKPVQYFSPWSDWAFVSAAAFFSAAIWGAFSLVADGERRRTIIVLLAGSVVLIAPSAVVVPYGPRNFLPTYLILITVACIFLAELLGNADFSAPLIAISSLSLAILVSTFAGYLAIYWQIDKANQSRNETIERAIENGHRTAIVQRLPYAEYVHHPDPKPGMRTRMFLQSNGFPKDMKLIVRNRTTQ